MSKKLALLLGAAAVVATMTFATPGYIPGPMQDEWTWYWQALLENYNDYDLGAWAQTNDYDAPFLVDTFTIPQGRLTDTLTCSEGGYFNIFFPDDAAEPVGLNAFKTWNSTNIKIFGPDSTAAFWPGYLGKNVILHKRADATDTASATGVVRIWMKYPPKEKERTTN